MKEEKKKALREIIGEVYNEKIDEGGYGSVYKFEYDGKVYALKEITLAKLKPKELNEYEKEAKFLSKFHNECVVKYYDSFTKDNKFYIIMEYAGNKTLKSFIDDKISNSELIEQETLNNIIKQICLGLK